MTNEIPDDLRQALDHLDPEDANAALQDFLDATPAEQAGMLAFIRGAGPEHCRQIALKHADGTPTAADLKAWLQ